MPDRVVAVLTVEPYSNSTTTRVLCDVLGPAGERLSRETYEVDQYRALSGVVFDLMLGRLRGFELEPGTADRVEAIPDGEATSLSIELFRSTSL